MQFIIILLLHFVTLAHSSCSGIAQDQRESLITELIKETSRNDTFHQFDKTQVEKSVRYLIQHMPKEDLCLDLDYFMDNLALAWKSRIEFSWGAQIPWELFLNDVLPYASLSEPRDNWRQLFHTYMRKFVLQNTTTVEAAIQINAKSWDIVSPRIIYSPGGAVGINSYSPFQTMRRHNSSCTGLSVFLVDALRSVGVPARVAGTPHWNFGPPKCPLGDESATCGNHNWVEFWSTEDRRWHFLDQGGSEEAIDVGWFYPGNTDTLRPHAGNHSIYATSWAPSKELKSLIHLYQDSDPTGHFPMVWEWENKGISAWDVTKRYMTDGTGGAVE